MHQVEPSSGEVPRIPCPAVRLRCNGTDIKLACASFITRQGRSADEFSFLTGAIPSDNLITIFIGEWFPLEAGSITLLGEGK